MRSWPSATIAASWVEIGHFGIEGRRSCRGRHATPIYGDIDVSV